ncbi:tRNA-(ms[2]io[6]A)-hydroxylase, partial [Escherichia coli]|nr:tRNA-(ms[2]io[6]A)-hydroxylase [Escherichia coli]
TRRKNDTASGQDRADEMVWLIKEELHQCARVLETMLARQSPYKKTTASRYAKGMIREIRTHEPATLIDKLICGAYIEARSCERFARLAPHLDDELNRFYVSLLRSEARHYQDYLQLAEQIAGGDISERVAHFGRIEAELIQTPDSEFRFHSGVPAFA